MDYLYDGTFEGLLTCIYYHYKKEKAAGIYNISSYQQSLLNSCETVETDEEKAKIVSEAINKKISREAYVNVYYCYLSDYENKENIILNFLMFGFKYGRNTMNFYTHEKVLPINEIFLKVSREVHRFLGILRFSDVSGILFARFSPDNDILILMVDHFSDRYKYEKFINIENLEYSQDEMVIQKLWKQYFSDLAIKERINSNLQFQLVPTRYRKNMAEFK